MRGGRRITLVMGAATLAAVAAMMLPTITGSAVPTERTAWVETVQVTLGDVEKVLAVTGCVRYRSEYAALAPASGVVAQVCVRAGERVEKGQALFRMDASAQEQAIGLLLGAPSGVSQELAEAAAQLRKMTVRAPSAGLVHRVDVMPNGGVMAGTPAVMLSTGEQVIRAGVVMADAVELRPGMLARLLLEDQLLGTACVTQIGELETDTKTGQTVATVTLEPEAALSLPLGAAVDAEIILAGAKGVPVLPVESIGENDEVWWVSDGRSYRTAAGVLLSDELHAWVSLPVGTQVIRRGEVLQGQRVREATP